MREEWGSNTEKEIERARGRGQMCRRNTCARGDKYKYGKRIHSSEGKGPNEKKEYMRARRFFECVRVKCG